MHVLKNTLEKNTANFNTENLKRIETERKSNFQLEGDLIHSNFHDGDGAEGKEQLEESKAKDETQIIMENDLAEDNEQLLNLEQIARLKFQKIALSRLSRGAPLPRLSSSHYSDEKSSISLNKSIPESSIASRLAKGPLFRKLQEEIKNEAKKFSPSSLRLFHEKRLKQLREYRIEELQEIPSFVPEDIREKAAIELKALKLLDVQKKVRYEVAMEKKLQTLCNKTHQEIFDWGMLRLKRADVANALSRWNYQVVAETDERIRHRHAIERRMKEEEEARMKEIQAKARFVTELQTQVREFQNSSSANIKRRKQRNDAVMAWHVKQRQRASKAERMRVQALKAGDQEAYMKLVEESKNARLKTLLGKTDDLLTRLGAMVQRQKDLSHEGEALPPPKEKTKTVTVETDKKGKGKDGKVGKDREQQLQQQKEQKEEEKVGKDRDLMEGQRRYDLAVHAIEEKVVQQPMSLKGGQLREYQIEGLQWMLSLYNNNLNGILADEMGLGKTIQTIAFLSYLQESKGLNGPHLVLAPKAVLPNWAHEFATWMPSMVAIVYDGKKEERIALREKYGGDGKFNVMITHYDLIMRDKAFLKKMKWHYLVVDEGHRLKNHESMLARTLVSGYHIRRRLLLTGTPIQNSLSELWSLLNFLLPAIFNSSQNFEEWFNAPFADKVEVGLNEEEELLVIKRLHQVIRPFLLRRRKAEVEKHLPQKKQVILKCDLSSWQRIYYRQILDAGRVGLDKTSARARSLQNTAMQLRKCCNHPYLFLEGMDYEPQDRTELVRCSGKFELLDRLLPKLKRTSHRILLFSQMTRVMDILEDYLSCRGYTYLRLDGNTKTEERGKLLEAFNAEDSPYFIFLLSTRAGGLGLNLQTADTVILFDSDWNPQMDQQAEDRAHRIGQKKEVRVFVLVSVGSIEEEILERAKSKMGIDAKVIQAGLFNTTSTAQERREMLEMIMKRGTSALGADVPGRREMNRSTARTEEEFVLFEEMDEERERMEAASGSKRAPLMEEWEVPRWVFIDVKEGDKAGEGGSGGKGAVIEGKRKREKVIYTDGLSESQWLKVVEEGEDMEEVVRAGRDRILKRREKKEQMMHEPQKPQKNLGRGRGGGDGGIEQEVMEEEIEEEEMDSRRYVQTSSHYESDESEEEKKPVKEKKNIVIGVKKKRKKRVTGFEEEELGDAFREKKWKFLHRETEAEQEGEKEKEEEEEERESGDRKPRSSFGFGKRSKRR